MASTLSYRNYLSRLAVHNNNQYFAHRVNLTNWLAAKRHAPDGATVISSLFGSDAFGLRSKYISVIRSMLRREGIRVQSCRAGYFGRLVAEMSLNDHEPGWVRTAQVEVPCPT